MNVGNHHGKTRVFYLSAVVPDTTSGGRLAMYRHLLEHNDFEVKIASASQATGTKVDSFPIRETYPIARLRKTRFVRLGHNLGYLWNWLVLPDELLREAERFNPDLILTVPDNWHCGLAWQLSRRLQVPLAVNFQDLFPLSQFLHHNEQPWPIVRAWLNNRFRYLNRVANLVFYTSDGMQNWFGRHSNGHVLYPIGHNEQHQTDPVFPSPEKPWTVVYAGNCYGAYGRMLLDLAYEMRDSENLQLRIFAAGNDWSAETVGELERAGIFRGFLPFEELKSHFEKADAFLTVMSFEPQEKPFVQTSFTTKWLDYAPYGKPVCIWAPEYSTAAKFAVNHGCGPLVMENDARSVVRKLTAMFQSGEQWKQYAAASTQVAQAVLNPNRLHQLFARQVQGLTPAVRLETKIVVAG